MLSPNTHSVVDVFHLMNILYKHWYVGNIVIYIKIYISNYIGYIIVTICLLWLSINVVKHVAMVVSDHCNWLHSCFSK